MGHPLRILIVEDSQEDTDLLMRELRRAGYDVTFQRVDCAETMAQALETEAWDIVISDYVIPGFGGLEALALIHERGLSVPFMVVSGHIGEDIAVATIKAGADDYLMKDRLARLVPAIERALAQAEIRMAHKRANEALCESEQRFRQLAENIAAVFFMFEQPTDVSPGSISYVSPAFERIWGYPSAILFRDADEWLKAIHPEDRPRVLAHLPQMARENFSAEFRIVGMDLRIRWVHYRTFPVRDQHGKVYRVAAIAEDITERKRDEAQLAANARQLEKTIEELRVTGEELRRSNEELSHARADLEQRVQERTAELTTANTGLRAAIAERKRLENELLEIAENERRRIGFDLHDDIGQKLMAVSLLLKALETNLTHRHVPEANDTRKVQRLIGQIVNHTHNLAHCFSNLDVEGTDLGPQLKKLVANVRKTFDINCRLRLGDSLPLLSQDVTLQLFKIAQESVSNAIKHGKATTVSVSLTLEQGQLVLQIRNDGVAFPVDREPNNRMGLRIMNFRAHTVGGKFEIRPNGNAGTIVTCTVPHANGNGNGNGANRNGIKLETLDGRAAVIETPALLEINGQER
jgi:PAS domain S-box-containing protein